MTRRRSLVQRSFSLSATGIGRRVAVGAGFQFLGIGLRTVLTVGSTAVLARLLVPADFGYVAMAAVVTELATLLGAFGLSNLLIQRKRIVRLQLDTVFWASLALGVVMAAFVLLASLAVGWLFSDPRVAPLLRVMSAGFVIASLSAVPTVILARQLRFRTEFLINVGAVAVRAAAAIALAWAGWGMWSLVLAGLIGHTAQAFLAFVNVPFLPRFRFQLRLLTQTWRTSGGYFGNTTLYYVNTQLDLLLIGKYLGAASLGLYQNARTLTDEIRARIAMPIQHVLFPALSSLQGDDQRFQELVLRAGRLLATIVILIGIGVSANAWELTLVLYGSRWEAMAPVMMMLGVSAAIRASTALSSPIFNASNRVGLSFKYNVAGTAILIAAICITLPMGIEKVAFGAAIASGYAVIPLRAALGIIGLRLKDLIMMIGPPALAAAVMWLAVELVRGLTDKLPSALALLLHVGACIAVYFLILCVVSRQHYCDLIEIAQTLRKTGTRGASL